MPQSVSSSGSPPVGRKRALPRKTEAKACPREPSNLRCVTRSGIGNSALPGTPAGGAIVDLLSSTAADHDTFVAQFLRPPQLRLPDRREGHRRLEVDGVGKVGVVHEGRPGLPGQEAALAAIRVAQPEDAAAAVEVRLDVHLQLFALDRTADVQGQPRLFRMELRVAALAPIDGDGARIEGILGADGIEVADDIQLDPSSRLEVKPPTANPSGAGVAVTVVWVWVCAAGSAGSVAGAEGPPSTGELVCALGRADGQQKHCGSHKRSQHDVRPFALALPRCFMNRSRSHRYCSDPLDCRRLRGTWTRHAACDRCWQTAFSERRHSARRPRCSSENGLSSNQRRDVHDECQPVNRMAQCPQDAARSRRMAATDRLKTRTGRHHCRLSAACGSRRARDDEPRDRSSTRRALTGASGLEYASSGRNERLTARRLRLPRWRSWRRARARRYTFAYARGWAYMTDDPRACANCHVMNEQYDGWIKSSHRSVAVCNDCHVPH